jgi:nanoRNase/pAp phosphatase (c-di-AMP/oligoRNAs hydrolase)
MKNKANAFIEAVKKYNPIAIYIPGSPDPDAITSAYAIMLILKYHSIDSDIFAEKRLSLTQNKAFIDKLKIPVIFGRKINLNKYQAYIVPDYQNNRVDQIGDKIPCAAHIDHHGKSENTIQADFSLLSKEVGSTSTMIALILKHLDVDIAEQDMIAMATALTFGIQTDTDKYNNITALDFEAMTFLSEYADREILQGINSIPISPETLQFFNKAKESEVVYRDWAFYGIGYIDSKNRDSIAITADMILKNSEHKVIAVFAVIENHRKKETYLDVSLRSKSSAVDLNRVIKNITPNGGGRSYKGAYQIKLNYLKNSPDKEMLWNVVKSATLETLRKSRDNLYITDIKGIYSSFRDKVRTIISRGRDKNG